MGYSPAAVAQRLDAIVEFSELGPFMDVPVKNYSSGMALRLGFALAVAFQPEIVLVDEVLAVADAHFQRRAYERLAALCAQGSTLVLVSHDMAALRQMCGRVVWLDQGRLRADGAPETVIGQYLSRAG
jgi:ABC-type polysaccharide/polyol phosphate transport system ATPase subunit